MLSPKAGKIIQIKINVDNPFQSPIVLSLCPGILGLERGVERALQSKLRVAAYSEIEAFIDANLIAGMEAGILAPAPIWSNIKTFPFAYFHGKIHGILGGYPCQPFSVAGQQKGESDPRHLWPFIREGIRAAGPIWCFFENVTGHLTIGYETVRSELQELGYIVKEGIFSSEEIGAPHQRKRLFILAIKSGVVQDDTSIFGYKSIHSISTRGNSTKLAGEATRGVDQFNASCRRSGVIQDPNSEGERYGIAGTSGILRGEGKTCGVIQDDSTGKGLEGHGRDTRSPEVVESGNSSNSGVGRVADPSSKRSEKRISESEQREEGESKIFDNSSDRRPARPGEDQYGWEAKRTTKPGMGITINGYNFREDLLRAAGNSVDEWVAEKAFVILLNKHFDT